MDDADIRDSPKMWRDLRARSEEIGFTMPSDICIGPFLKTLVTSKPKSNLLELGTGTGLALSWMIDGMDAASKLITIDNDPNYVAIAKNHFGSDKRVTMICTDAAEWIRSYQGEKFDLIFADAWPGKYSETDKALSLLKAGGFYVIDDMPPHPNWPDGHHEKISQLIEYLEKREDLNLTKMNWSTGLIMCVKTS